MGTRFEKKVFTEFGLTSDRLLVVYRDYKRQRERCLPLLILSKAKPSSPSLSKSVRKSALTVDASSTACSLTVTPPIVTVSL